ncbi:unnamed protein product [Urochloa humidicola]
MASRPPAPDEPGDLRICTPALPSVPQLVAAQTLLPPDVGGTSGSSYLDIINISSLNSVIEDLGGAGASNYP